MKRDFGAKVKKKKNTTQPQPPNLRKLSRTRAPAHSASRGFYFFFSPSEQNVKNVLNEKFSSYK